MNMLKLKRITGFQNNHNSATIGGIPDLEEPLKRKRNSKIFSNLYKLEEMNYFFTKKFMNMVNQVKSGKHVRTFRSSSSSYGTDKENIFTSGAGSASSPPCLST
jgi:hypothetical protein